MRLWKKVLAAATAGVLCLGSAGVTGLQNTLESVGTVLSVSAEGTDETERVPVSTGTTTVRVGTGTTQLEYQAFDDDTVEITDCDNEAAGELEIPAEIDGKPVTSIGDGAFSVCSGLTEITIPDSVTSIGGSTFLKTPWLTAKQAENPLVIVNHILIDGKTCTGAVSIPNGVTSIGDSAFVGCSSLTEITIPDSVTSIGDYAFYDCTNLTIYGYTGSYAETYAKENDIPFVSLGNITTTETTTTTIETTVTTTTETMVTTKTTTTTKQDSETPTVIYGDITLDGRVDITDAVLLNKFCSGAVILNDAAKLNSDCDGDGDITGNDAVALLQFLVQIVQKLPYTA